MEFIVGFLGPFIDTMKNLWTLYNDIRSLERNTVILRSQIEDLSSREHDVMMEVDREEVHQGKKRKREVDTWLRRVKRMSSDLESIEERVRQERGWFSRYELTMLVSSKTNEAVELLEKGGFPDGVALVPLIGSGSPQHTATLLDQSAYRTLNEIRNYLMDDGVGKVGVHGMGGVGKTTIMRHINNQLLEANVFSSIIWVTVSRAFDLERVQRHIAKAIGLDLSDDSDDDEESKSSKICAALTRRRKFLLILDDVWGPFPLERIGIPEPDQRNGCKLVFTTRDIKVCRGMESQRIVKVKVLPKEESWDLFKEKIGSNVLDSSQIKPIAKSVLDQCGCLPLAIITVGRALREVDDVGVWRNASNELQHSHTDIEGMDDYVLPHLKFSYDRLKNNKLRACFLYCALYPEDCEINIEILMENWIGDGLIDEVWDREKEMDKVHTMLTELKDACLIEHEKFVTFQIIKLHDLIRDLAIEVTRGSPLFMIKAAEQLKKSPSVEEWKEHTERVSLMRNKIEVFRGQPVCPKLSTLLLQENKTLHAISNSFFEHIQGLKVLDLSDTSIESLPKSFSKLENLRVLRLRDCSKLKKVPSLAKLKSLRVLNLSGTGIIKLPEGMKELANLRFLYLCGTSNLQIVPAGIMSELSCLEDFRMHGSRWEWPSNIMNETRVYATVEEFACCTQLANLSISIVDLPGFLSFVGSRTCQLLRTFLFSVGNNITISNSSIPKRRSVQVHDFDLGNQASSFMIPSNTDTLRIEKCHGLARLSQLPCLAMTTELKDCLIFNCHGMEFIMMAGENTLTTSLETLNLNRLPDLRSLCHGAVPFDTFANLKRLVVHQCNKMNTLLPLGFVEHLKNLEGIEVTDCHSIKEIMAEDANATGTSALPRLKTLELKSLPKLKNICSMQLSCTSLVSITVWGCPMLKKLPLSIDSFSPIFEELHGKEEWWNALEWDHPDAKSLLQSRFRPLIV